MKKTEKKFKLELTQDQLLNLNYELKQLAKDEMKTEWGHRSALELLKIVEAIEDLLDV